LWSKPAKKGRFYERNQYFLWFVYRALNDPAGPLDARPAPDTMARLLTRLKKPVICGVSLCIDPGRAAAQFAKSLLGLKKYSAAS
jgi:hypothetical protein